MLQSDIFTAQKHPQYNLWTQIKLFYSWLKPINGFILTCLFCALIFIFLPFSDEKWRSLYIVLVVVVSWIVGYVDIVIIGLVPLILGPLLDLRSFPSLVSEYMSTTILLYITASILGIGLDRTGLAKRFALFMMRGSNLEAYDLSWRFFFTGCITSMWIADTASMTLIIPILQQMIKLVADYNAKMSSDSVYDVRVFKPPKNNLSFRNMEAILFLSLAYGTCTGGMMTMIGSGSNFAFLENWERDFGINTPITFLNWMIYGIPMGIITGFSCWLGITISWYGPVYTYKLFVYFSKSFYYMINRKNPNNEVPGIKTFYEAQKNAIERMPPMSFSEKLMVTHFSVTLALLFLRDPGIPGFGGWDSLFGGGGMTHDAFTTLICGFVALGYPRYSYHEVNKIMDQDPFPTLEKRKNLINQRMITWNDVHTDVAWGIMFVLGGGFSMAAMLVDSGTVDLFAEALSTFFEPMSEALIVFFTITISSILTEFMSAVVLLNIISPVLNQVAVRMRMNPIILSYNAVFATVNGACTPIATTSNVLATRIANLSFPELIRTGWLFKVFAIVVQMFCVYTYGYPLLDLGSFPSWAEEYAIANGLM